MEKNKTGKYLKYAIGEIVLVVIGILIALQVNNWNEIVKNDHQKNEILKAVNKEFVINKDRLNLVIKEHQKCYKSSKDLIQSFPIDIEIVNLDSLRSAILNSIGQWTFEPSQTRIKFLLSSQDFNLIKDEELRDVLLNWEAIYEDWHEDEQKATDFNNDILFPYLNKYFPMVVDLNDSRYDKTILESFEFENMIIKRHLILEEILFNKTNELKILKQAIDNIIVFTEPYAK